MGDGVPRYEKRTHTSEIAPGGTSCDGFQLLLALTTIVVGAVIALSLAIAATGTARFAESLGYRPIIGYVIGVILDVAKAVTFIVGIRLWKYRHYALSSAISAAWICLEVYCCLATEATLTTAVAAVERNATLKTESRANLKAELSEIERRLAVLSQPTPPRPAATVAEALATEKVPSSVWRNSHECRNIRESRYFRNVCHKISSLRRELAAAQDYEKLDARASSLRLVLSHSPIVATADPLPAAFAMTVGRIIPIDGQTGVVLLLTLVLELLSCTGLAVLSALREGKTSEQAGSTTSWKRRLPQLELSKTCNVIERSAPVDRPLLKGRSVKVRKSDAGREGTAKGRRASREGRSPQAEQIHSSVRGISVPPSKTRAPLVTGFPGVEKFWSDRLYTATGKSVSAAELWLAYRSWCAAQHCSPVSQKTFGVALKALRLAKWKSCGLVRYRDLQIISCDR